MLLYPIFSSIDVKTQQPSTTKAAIERINSNLTTPTIASSTRQRPPMTRSASNAPPWVAHYSKQGTIQIGRQNSATSSSQQERGPSAASSTSSTATESLASTPATSPAPGFRPTTVQAIQPSSAYKKYSSQIRYFYCFLCCFMLSLKAFARPLLINAWGIIAKN
jgi:hypothetical protein